MDRAFKVAGVVTCVCCAQYCIRHAHTTVLVMHNK